MKKTITLLSSLCLITLCNNVYSMMPKKITPDKLPFFYKAYQESLNKNIETCQEYKHKNFKEKFIEHLRKIANNRNTAKIAIDKRIFKCILDKNDIEWAEKIEHALVKIESHQLQLKHNTVLHISAPVSSCNVNQD